MGWDLNFRCGALADPVIDAEGRLALRRMEKMACAISPPVVSWRGSTYTRVERQHRANGDLHFAMTVPDHIMCAPSSIPHITSAHVSPWDIGSDHSCLLLSLTVGRPHAPYPPPPRLTLEVESGRSASVLPDTPYSM